MSVKCPACGSTDIAISQQLNLKDAKVRKIYLSGACTKCKSQVTIEYTPTTIRQQTVE